MRSVLLLLALLTIGKASAQGNEHDVRVLGGYSLGLDAAKRVSSKGEAFTPIPWLAGTLDLGASVTHRDRWGFAVMGAGAINGWIYKHDSINYNVYHLTKRIEARAWWLFPMHSGKAEWFRVGCGFGYSFFPADDVGRSEGSFTGYTFGPHGEVPFIAPEIGLTKDNYPNRVEVGLRYVRHLDRTPAVTTTTTIPTGTSTFAATDDMLALVFRFHLGFSKEVPPIEWPSMDYEARTTDTLAVLTTHRDHITLRLWDNAEVDGDTVSVLWNNNPVLSGYELTKKPVVLHLDMRYDTNKLLVVAHNEGRVPPNTASCSVHRGKGREELLIRTSRKNNQAVVFKRK